LFLLRSDDLWAVAECLRCRGVAATVAAPPRPLSRVEARRLQLAAERGGGAGILLRRASPSTTAHYAAATRWLVGPAPGADGVQRWHVRLLHGHGGRVGQAVLLEIDRDSNHVRATDPLADRPAAAPAAPATARASA
jgi:protein ImuA